MRNHTVLLMLSIMPVFFYASSARAGFYLPDDAYTMNEYANALEEARDGKWPITFFFTDKHHNCRFVIESSIDILREFKDDSLVVYISPDEVNLLPDSIFMALANSGSKIPRIVITDSCAEKIITTVPYKSNREEHLKMLQEARERMLAYDAAACSSVLPPKIYMIAGAGAVFLILGFFIFKKRTPNS